MCRHRGRCREKLWKAHSNISEKLAEDPTLSHGTITPLRRRVKATDAVTLTDRDVWHDRMQGVRNGIEIKMSALDFVQSWLSYNAVKLGELGLIRLPDSIVFKPSSSKKCWSYESERYLVLIQAWENAACLDFDVMDKESKTIVFHPWGPCDDQAGLAARLESFIEWLEQQSKSVLG